MRLATTGTPAAQASRILMRVPEPTRSEIAVAKARSRYGLTEATSPSMATSFEASARTRRGGLRPTIKRRAPGKSARQRGQISLASATAASALGAPVQRADEDDV